MKLNSRKDNIFKSERCGRSEGSSSGCQAQEDSCFSMYEIEIDNAVFAETRYLNKSKAGDVTSDFVTSEQSLLRHNSRISYRGSEKLAWASQERGRMRGYAWQRV